VDRFGIKQLHYAVDNTMLAFASKPSALLTLPGVEQRIDPTAALGSLRSGFVAPQPSMWGAIRRLAPGQLLRWRDGQLKIEVNVAPNIRGSREPDRLYRAKEAT
jgi:asparagine synthetase B (glutamine-hydrolysing)